MQQAAVPHKPYLAPSGPLADPKFFCFCNFSLDSGISFSCPCPRESEGWYSLRTGVTSLLCRGREKLSKQQKGRMARLISILIWQAANEAQTTEEWRDKDRHISRKSCATHSFQCVQYFRLSKQWIPMFGTVNLRTHVDACDCIQGLNGCRKRVCTESWLWEKNPLPHRDSNPRQYSAWPFSRTLYPLSHRDFHFPKANRAALLSILF